MEIKLNPIEVRILGVLIEKEMSTPDYYPMTLNALVNACNQKTNRDSVMNLDEPTVQAGLENLRELRLVWQVKTHNSRVLKYEHNMKDVAAFSPRELGLLCELMLRGPQTAGELRSRTARLVEFSGLPVVESTLNNLIHHEKGSFVVQLNRRPGHKENRYAHLFSEVDLSEDAAEPGVERIEPRYASADGERLTQLELTVAALQEELKELKTQFEDFKKNFE